ncbi:MAG TPA: LysR family transcriptional regulator [Dongiaceae bacterium]|nr:LysR family transcriptional regulator [Dongiaceae bacterium]
MPDEKKSSNDETAGTTVQTRGKEPPVTGPSDTGRAGFAMRRQIPPCAPSRRRPGSAASGAAAEGLNITQSAVSHQIAGLEERLGTSLFHRTARRVELTEAGGLHYPSCAAPSTSSPASPAAGTASA